MIPNTKQEGPVFRIFDFIRDGVRAFDPLAVDDKKDVKIRFSEKVTIDEKGFKTKVEAYESDVVTIDPVSLFRNVTYSNLVKCTDISYQIGVDESLLSRIETYSFMKNGVMIQVGSKEKHYTGAEGITEGIKRRDNVINLLKQTTAYLTLVTEPLVLNVPASEIEAKLLGNEIGIEINNFLSFNAYDELIQAITDSAVYYMNNPISATETIRTRLIKTIEDSKIG